MVEQTSGADPASADVASILDTIDVPIVVVGRDCALVRFNRAAAQTLGLAPPDVGRQMGTAGALADMEGVEKACAQVIADGTSRRRDIRNGDRSFLLRLVPYAGSAGQIAGAVVTFTNVTAFRASIEQAVYEREYTKAILNTVTNPLVVLDSELRIQSGNRAFYAMFGVSREKTQGIPLRTLGDDDWKAPGLWESLHAILRDGSDFQPVEIARDLPEAGVRTLLLDAHRVSRDGDGTILLAVQDITERKRTEDELRNAGRRKDEFLALLAHELRNPLAPIRTGLELIRVSGDTQQSVGRVRSMMERQINQMARLIDDLLDVSRITSGKIVLHQAPTALRELVESAVETHRSAIDSASIELTVDLPDRPIIIDVDPTRFVQILSNVLHNATKFTPAQGKIRCSAELLADLVPQVAITVSDTGSGIAQEFLPRLFELFAQAEPPTERAHGGLGIGLALARQLVQMHGGEIAASSDGPGRGSAFVITMPLSKTVAAAPSAASSHVPSIPSRIVVIDDNRDAADAMAMLIEALGGSAHVAYDAASGLEAVQDFKPDVVFLDIGMPRVDGYEVCRRIRQQPSGRHIIVVAVTGWGQPQDKQRALDAGFDAHLTKPVDPAALGRVLAVNASGELTS